jgi:hypothetical protein
LAKRKVIIKSCGNCHICGKEHMSNEGGWVINAERLNFCHSIEHSCFDMYLANVHAPEKQGDPKNITLDKRMEMYINYLKTKKCRHKYATER